jgi:hypothetical protein
VSPSEFCREIEAYLCRKNDGHLIRIVGPVFEKVCGWAEQGVPLAIACRGIDRYFDRHRVKLQAPRRRPVRVEFCEADILDAFDEWRRAVGVSVVSARPRVSREAPAPDDGVDGAAEGEVAQGKRKPGLQTHIDRVMARLTQRRVEVGTGSELGATIDRVLSELDTLRAGARGVRSEARAALSERLAALDRALIDAARAALDADTLRGLRAEAARELEPFRSRLAADAWQAATEAALDRLVRDRWRLPDVKIGG